jgi:hypothetical protein
MFTTHTDYKTIEISEPKRNESIIKPTLILATLLFLIVAPEPDSRDIAELSANFLVTENHSVLLASTEPSKGVQEDLQR